MNKAARWLTAVLVLIVLGLAGVELYKFLTIPKTAAEALAAARKEEARNAAAIAAKQAAGTLTPDQKDKHLSATYEAYARVEEMFPGTPEVEEADWRVLQLRDENSSTPANRIELAEQFLDKHTSTSRAADLRWRIAELTHRELKRLMDAVRLYEKFAEDHRKDSRAPEALFRVAQIFEEIKEFARAVEAYQRVAREFPQSDLADQAQFRAGTLLADQLERKEEAAKAFAEVERNAPQGSRLAQQAGDQRRRLVTEGEQTEQQRVRRRYYGGVEEVLALDRFLNQLDSPPFQQLRTQGMNLVGTSGSLMISPVDRTLTATATLEIIARESTATMVLQVGSPLSVTRVEADLGQGQKPYRYDRRDDFVFVDFGRDEVPAGTTFTVTVDYGGVCQDSWGIVMINSTSTMLMGSHALPTLNLGDSRPVRLEVTVPEEYTAVATGAMVDQDRTQRPGWITSRFRLDQPVFYSGVAVAKYQTFEEDYVSTVTGRTLPLAIHLLPGMTTSTARIYLDKLPDILSFYESLLGPFPYDKLAVAQVSHLPGGLGTPGILMLGPPAWVNPEVPAVFLAHEVSHAWFGNLVGLDLSVDSPIWLSEGFAEYLDALYHEHENGSGSLARTMRERAVQFFTMTARIRERALADLRGNISALAPSSYVKGAYVIHMLRSLMGDEAFVRFLRSIIQQHAEGILRLKPLQALAEKAAGEPLDWFFDQWVQGVGIPRLEVVDACLVPGEGNRKDLSVVIVQKGPKTFRLPIDLQVELESGSPWKARLDLRETTSIVVLQPPGKPVRVVLDPETWVLRHPRFEEWERAVSDECTTAGMSAVDSAILPRPAALGGSLIGATRSNGAAANRPFSGNSGDSVTTPTSRRNSRRTNR
jgi:tetratricopeptide (TPR) repeat protein